MKIPSEIAIKSILKPGSVFYFTEDSFQSQAPHFFVILNKDPISENLLLMVNATSNVSERKNWVTKVGLPSETLVEADSEKCVFLDKKSVHLSFVGVERNRNGTLPGYGPLRYSLHKIG